MLRLASTVTVRAAVSVKPKVAMSVEFVSVVDPGISTPPSQFVAVLQFPAASTFHELLAACDVKAPAINATAHRSVNTPFGRER